MRTLPAIAAITVLSASCGGSEGPGTAPDHRLDPQIWMVSGSDQWSLPGVPLPQPFVVQVRNGPYGEALAGIRVQWTITSGNGTFAPGTVTMTGADGRTMVTFTAASAGATAKAAIEGRPASSVLFRPVPLPAGVAAVYARPGAESPATTGSAYFLFYEGNRFGIYMHPWGAQEVGTYTRNGTVLSMVFEGTTWAATATIRGDSLTVNYNASATTDDWQDETLVLTLGALPPQ